MCFSENKTNKKRGNILSERQVSTPIESNKLFHAVNTAIR